MSAGVVYCYTNTINNKRYVGQTADLTHRSYEHVYYATRGGSNCPVFYNAIRKYGIASFSCEVLATADTNDQLDELERKFIAEFNTMDSRYGYNLTEGGYGSRGMKHTAEAKAKISAFLIGNKHTLGYTPTAETRAKVSAALKGKIVSLETRAKMSKSMQGQKRALGVVRTPEFKEKLRIASTGRKHSPETKAKLSAMRLGTTHIGVPHTEESKAKMRLAKLGTKHTAEHIAKRLATVAANALLFPGKRTKKSVPHTPESKAKIGAASKGRKHTEESKAKMRAARMGKRLSEETKSKISMASSLYVHTEETKAKIRAAHIGRKKSAEHVANMVASRKASRLRKIAEAEAMKTLNTEKVA